MSEAHPSFLAHLRSDSLLPLFTSNKLCPISLVFEEVDLFTSYLPFTSPHFPGRHAFGVPLISGITQVSYPKSKPRYQITDSSYQSLQGFTSSSTSI